MIAQSAIEVAFFPAVFASIGFGFWLGIKVAVGDESRALYWRKRARSAEGQLRSALKQSAPAASGNQATARSDKHETETGVGAEPRPQDRQEAAVSFSSERSASGEAVQRPVDGDRE